jgi:hypothetical protein
VEDTLLEWEEAKAEPAPAKVEKVDKPNGISKKKIHDQETDNAKSSAKKTVRP